MTAVVERYFPQINQLIYRATLDSGLNLTLIPKPDFKEITGILRVRFGGIDTEFTVDDNSVKQPYGLAHFLEHQVFENNGQADYAQKFTSFGSDSNAFTGFTATNYYFTTVDKLEENLTTLLDLVSDCRFSEQSMVKEKGIISQEIAMYQDEADYRLYAGALAGLFPGTPMAEDLAGTDESIEAISFDDLKLAFDTFYQPSQMHLVLVGDLSLAQLEPIISRHQLSQAIDSPVNLSKQDLVLGPVNNRQSLKLEVSQPKLAVAFRPKEILKTDLLYGKLVLKLYTGLLLGWTSTAYQEWYDQKLIDDSFDVQIDIDDRYQFVMVTMDTNQPIAMAAKIKQTLKRPSKKADLTEEHFLLLKKEFYGEFFTSQDNIEDLAVSYLENDFADGTYFDLPELLGQLTLAEVLQVGQTFFAEAEAVDFTILPKIN